MNWGKGLYSGHPKMYIEEENHGQMNSTSINRDCSRGTDIPTSVQYNGGKCTFVCLILNIDATLYCTLKGKNVVIQK